MFLYEPSQAFSSWRLKAKYPIRHLSIVDLPKTIRKHANQGKLSLLDTAVTENITLTVLIVAQKLGEIRAGFIGLWGFKEWQSYF